MASPKAEPDSLGREGAAPLAPVGTPLPADSTLAADSLRALPPLAPLWDREWLLAALGPCGGDTLLTREQLLESSGMLLADALERDSRLGVYRSGGHGAWDQLYDLAPGLDRLTLWDGGVASAGAALPEANPNLLSLLPLRRLVRTAPDPLLDPLAVGQDGLLHGTLESPEPGPARSAIRLAEGPGGSATEDFLLTRRQGAWGLIGSYAHSRADGRPLWIDPRYGASHFQNLSLDVERGFGWGAARVWGADRQGRAILEPDRKLLWEAQRLAAGWQKRGERWSGELQILRRNDRLLWWSEEESRQRRTRETEAHARGLWDAGALALYGAAAVERVEIDFARNRHGSSLRRDGTGCAMALSWAGARRSLYAAVGYADPWWGEGGLRGHVLAGERIGPLRGVLEAGRHASYPFTPRLDGDGRALLDEGLFLPDGDPVDAVDPRETRELELRLELGGADRGARAGWLVRRIRGALGVDPLLAEDLAPGMRDTLEAARGDLDLQALRASARLEFGWGARIEIDGTLIVDPEAGALPVLTPRYRARGVLALGWTFFQGDLHLEGRLIGIARDELLTPAGLSPASERLDAELRGRLGGAHFFLAVRHLENGPQDSATYADDAWMPLPYRSSQAGVEWHFLD